MRTDELDFDLPRERIATAPAEPRDSSRMLVVSRSDPARLEHARTADLPSYLRAGDRLVFNSTRVLPARLVGVNLDTGGRIGGLYLHDAHAEGEHLAWKVLLKARRLRPGRRVELTEPMTHPERPGPPTGVVLTLLKPGGDDEPGSWVVAVRTPPGLPAESAAVLARAGMTPLPPYIMSARRERHEIADEARDRATYQTVYASDRAPRAETPGSVAAPTAGLHFTPGLLSRLAAAGVHRSEVVLHVGAGTFKPVETDRLEDHTMHAEWCSLAGSAPELFGPREPGGRLLAVGTTSARTIESFALHRESPGPDGPPLPEWLSTRLLIAPGYRWRAADGMLTNFHLPRSTLLAMVGSLFDGPGGGGVARLKQIYAEAIRAEYRFFSFGDAMLILP